MAARAHTRTTAAYDVKFGNRPFGHGRSGYRCRSIRRERYGRRRLADVQRHLLDRQRHVGRRLQLIRSAAALAAGLAAIAGGCTTAPPASAAVEDGGFEISVRNLEISPERDSCGKLAGSLALFDLLDVEMPKEMTDSIAAALARRCPDDTEPEAFDLELFVPEGACPELREMLALAGAFDAVALLQPDRRRMAAGFIDRLEDELERRCPLPPRP